MVDDSFEMSEMLRLQYKKAFSDPAKEATIDDPESFFEDIHNEDSMEPTLPNLHFSFQDVIEAIDNLSANASPGPNYFPAILLKKAKFTLCHPLLEIYQSSFIRQWRNP